MKRFIKKCAERGYGVVVDYFISDFQQEKSKEVIRKCKWCGESFVAKGYGCTRRQFCSEEHRKKFYAKQAYLDSGGAEGQRKRLDKRRVAKYGKDRLVQCKICHKWYRQVGSHVFNTHGMTAREYREQYGFDVKRGQLPPDYRELKAEHVFENRTVENLEAGKEFRFKKGQEGIGVYKRSEQTMKRLRGMDQLFKKND